jgi:hypothetical protein
VQAAATKDNPLQDANKNISTSRQGYETKKNTFVTLSKSEIHVFLGLYEGFARAGPPERTSSSCKHKISKTNNFGGPSI